ncbi:centromere protein M-like [Gigantopelta aegis]|uniref:centromere protein M-like n=1 Tax=Gigantopelta aegis TaxID=1735272 RepID=UPI001B889B04|nr:centromere protein M-like [Gigantopelta aegis]
MTTIISPLDKLPSRQEAAILIIGAEGVGKHNLALSIVNVSAPFAVQCRIATELPLTNENSDTRPRIDFLCYVLSQANKSSVQTVKDAFTKVDVRYFIGRSCLVVCRGKDTSKWSVDAEMISQLTDNFDLPVLFVDIECPNDRSVLANRILSMLEVAAGFKKNVSPLLFDATRMNYEMTL